MDAFVRSWDCEKPLLILFLSLSDTCGFAEPKGLLSFPYGDQLLSGPSLLPMELIMPSLLTGLIYEGAGIPFVQVVLAISYLVKALYTSEF